MWNLSKYGCLALLLVSLLCQPQEHAPVQTAVTKSRSDLDINLETRQMKIVDTGQTQLLLRVSVNVDATKPRVLRFNSIGISAYDVGSVARTALIEARGTTTFAMLSDERNTTPERLLVSYSHDGEVPVFEENVAYLDCEIILPKGRGYVLWAEVVVSQKGENRIEMRSLPLVVAVD